MPSGDVFRRYRELPKIGNINIVKMSNNNIAKEISNRMMYICDDRKVNINKRVLSILLDKSERYFSRLCGGSYDYFSNLNIIMDFSRLLKIPPYVLFLPKSEDFKKIFDNEKNIIEIKKTVKKRIEIKQDSLEDDNKKRCLKKALKLKKEEISN